MQTIIIHMDSTTDAIKTSKILTPIFLGNFKGKYTLGRFSLILQGRQVVLLQIIFDFFLDHWAHCSIFENGVLLIYTLEIVSSVANSIAAYEESQ